MYVAVAHDMTTFPLKIDDLLQIGLLGLPELRAIYLQPAGFVKFPFRPTGSTAAYSRAVMLYMMQMHYVGC